MSRIVRLTERDLTRLVRRVINEQESKYFSDNYEELKEFEPFKTTPNSIIFNTEKGNEQIKLNFKDVSGKDRDMIIKESSRENYGGRLLVYLGLYEMVGGQYSLNNKIQVNSQYPLNTIISFQRNGLIPGKDGFQN